MTIVHLSCVAPPELGGMGKVAAEEVALLRARGHTVSHISLTSHSRWRIGNVGYIPHLTRLVQSADIVHLHYPFYGVAGALARLRRRGVIRRLVLTVHMDAMAPGLKGWVANLHRSWFQSSILRAADTLIASSRDYAESSSYREVVSRLVELPFGVDESRFSPGPKDRKKYGIPDDIQVVLFVGVMDTAHAFKGVEVLLHAIAKLPSHIWCVLAGEGNLRSRYEAQAQEFGIVSRVRFLGRVSSQDLPSVFRLADVLAMPSVSGAEAFGLVALEAQASGIPVVASELPGVRTIVAHKESGFLVPPKDVYALATQLQHVLEDAALRSRMGEVGRRHVIDQYTWTRHIERLEDIYEGLCALPL